MLDLNTFIWTCIRFDGLKGLDFAKAQYNNGNIDKLEYKIVELFYCGVSSFIYSLGNWDRYIHVCTPSDCRTDIIYSQSARMAASLYGDTHSRTPRYINAYSIHHLKANVIRLMSHDNMDKYINFCISYKHLL